MLSFGEVSPNPHQEKAAKAFFCYMQIGVALLAIHAMKHKGGEHHGFYGLTVSKDQTIEKEG